MHCIILDGWHKGEMISAQVAAPELHLARLRVVTCCHCSEEPSEFDSSASVHTYKLAFTSVDGQTALYSVKGNSDAAWRDIGSLVRRLRPLGLDTLYVDCQDVRAWPEEEGR